MVFLDGGTARKVPSQALSNLKAHINSQVLHQVTQRQLPDRIRIFVFNVFKFLHNRGAKMRPQTGVHAIHHFKQDWTDA
jgi:hypothetical protein